MNRAIGLFSLLLAVLFVGCGGADQTANGREASQEPQTTTAPIPTLSATVAVATEAAVQETNTPPPTQTPVPTSTRLPTQTPLPSPTPQPTRQPATAIALSPFASGFERPTSLSHALDDRLFVSEQAGLIWIIKDGETLPLPFLDIRDRVASGALERGLFSLAFHPLYPQNGALFASYTDLSGTSVVSRFHVLADNPDQADAAAEEVLLRVDQPYANHNGGQIHFGPDGFLYIGLGDGGSAGDPGNHGQNTASLLGALLRIDVDGERPYAIPVDNPFVGGGGLPEVWAYGLRNPWRFSFDRLTGDLYIADVGQSQWEEINFQSSGSAGGQNYGWRILEGDHCYATSGCTTDGTITPVTEYSHQEGGCSVTGGYVYRGSRYPELSGNYFFGDYCSGFIWSLFRDETGVWSRNLVARSELNISAFGEDASGELYIIGHTTGTIYLLEAEPGYSPESSGE